MPIHDWTRVDAGIFHHFHHGWTAEIAAELNGGVLPEEFFALAEQVVSGPIPDVVTLQHRDKRSSSSNPSGGVALADAPPKASFVLEANVDPYVSKANRIRIQHRMGKVVAMIEIVSPGNKGSQYAMRSFVEKTQQLLLDGINLLVIDLFPPTRRDPQGIHNAIWETIIDGTFEPPSKKPLTVVAYAAREPIVAYVEPLAVGDALPSLPIFLNEAVYVPAPLEKTYEATWRKTPKVVRDLVESSGD